MKRDLQLDLEPSTAQLVARPVPQWRHALPIVGLLTVWILAWYAPTALSMVDIWERSATFTHGYVVPLIVLWLVWLKRKELATIAPEPSWLTLAPLGLAGLAWLVGELATVNAISQFALTALLVLSVTCVVGTAIARKLAFALAFLFFAVPIGEFMLPYLMTWTADFTVAALRLTGVPVYREGQQLIIPTGVWSVVEACSGLRYLIASVMVGTLFAYLMYRSLSRRLMFVAVAIIVPIVANWIRAYMIVMIGHLSNNKLAVGVDHLIYGWLFFGFVIACLFWIGGRWREDHIAPLTPVVRATADRSVSGRRIWGAAAAVLVVLTASKIGYFVIDRSQPVTRSHLASPSTLGEWAEVPVTIANWKPIFVNPSAELQRTFAHGARRIGLIVSYYRNQDYSSKLVSSDNKLVKSDDFTWVHLRAGTRDTRIDGKSLAVRTAELRGPGGQELLVWHWYWINGRLTSTDHWAKAYTALSRLRGDGDDSAAVVIYTRRDLGEDPERILEAFVQSAGSEIEALLRQTRDAQ